MKNTMKFYLFPLILFVQCSKTVDFYHGYVYDEETKMPLENVLVVEQSMKKNTSTNEQGLFKIKNDSILLDQLVFSKTGYKSDTAMTVWALHGEYLVYRFLNRNPDTLFMEQDRKNE